jgi:hypothetical protein
MKNKKFNPDMLTLGLKKEVVKDAMAKPAVGLIEKAVEEIHVGQGAKALADEKKKEIEPTKRTTVDIPVSLHKLICKHLVDKDQTLRDYFLELARKDLKIEVN